MTGRACSTALLGAAPFAALLLLWQAAVASGAAPPSLLPSPGAVAVRFAESLVDPTFLGHLAATGRRLAAGFSIALALGVSLGLLAATNKVAGAALRPLVRILAPVPKIALYPALLLSMGFADGPKVVLVAADAVFPILLATVAGAGGVDPKLVWSARAAGISAGRAVWTVMLPAAAPAILTGARIGLVVGCIVVFLAEMIAATDGLGYLLARAGRSFQAVDMFVPLVTISLVGLLSTGLLTLIRRRLLAGYPDGD